MTGCTLFNENVRTHGNFKEFLTEHKCEACQRRPGCKCLIQEGDNKCVSCAGADQECVFRRSIIASGSPDSFKWTRLIETDDMTLEEFISNRIHARPSSRFLQADDALLYERGATAKPIEGIPERLQDHDIHHTQRPQSPYSVATDYSAPGLADGTDVRSSSLDSIARWGGREFKRVFQAVIHLANGQNAQRVFCLDTGAELDIISSHVVESLGLKKEQYQKTSLRPTGGSRPPTSQVTFDWHVAGFYKTFTTTFAVVDDKLSKDFDILLGHSTIQDVGFHQTQVPIDPPLVTEDNLRFRNSKGSGQPLCQSNTLYSESSLMDGPGPWHPFWVDHRPSDSLIARRPDGRRYKGGSSLPDLQNASGSPGKDRFLPLGPATFQDIFKTGKGPSPGRKRRMFSDVEKQHMQHVRKIGACSTCKLKKKKCSHPIESSEHIGDSTADERMTDKGISPQDTLENGTGCDFAVDGNEERPIDVAQNLNGAPSPRATADEGIVSTPSLPTTLQNLEVLPNPLVPHETRVQLVAMLQEQIRRLNDELKVRQDASENVPVLTEQDVVAQALKEDSQIVETDPMSYQSKMKSRVIVLKQMELEDWKRERTRKVTSLLPSLMDGGATPAPNTSSSRVDIAQPSADYAIDDQTRPGTGSRSLHIGDNTSANHEPASYSKNNWICEICSIRISTQRDLSRHKETQHKINDSGGPIHKYLCAFDGCPSMVKAFNRRDNFRMHIQRMHPQEDVGDLLKRSAHRVDSTPVSKINGPAPRSPGFAMVVLYSETGGSYVDICAKVDESMPVSIISTRVLLQMAVSYMTCHKLELKDATGETHRPIGKVPLRWRKVEGAKSFRETFMVVDSNTMFAIFEESMFFGTKRPVEGS
ncbi:MAG: hypothetical protein Q9224_000519 [Gallowayella concinna]